MTDEDEGVQRSLGRIEGLLGSVVSNQEKATEVASNHEVRLKKVENKQNWILGAATGVGVAASAAFQYFFKV